MKVMLRKVGEKFEIYVPKKDLEELVVEAEKDGIWGGRIKIANGWVFEMPEMPPDTRLPITVDARKISGDDD